MKATMELSNEDKKSFLKNDLRDALTGVFVGAVSWQAHPEKTDDRGVRGLGMYTTFLQARSLYEFFFGKAADEKHGERARARHFASGWKATDPDKLRARYMTKPANNRLFHLVYGRSKFGGASKADESAQLKNQVLRIAIDIHRLTQDFVGALASPFRELAEGALGEALETSRSVQKKYGIEVKELA